MPELNKLQGKLRQLEQYYSSLRTRWIDDEAYYDGSYTFYLPDGANKIVPATGRNAIDVPATHIVTDKPTIHRGRDFHGKRAQNDDDDVEAFWQAFLLANQQMALTPPLQEVVKFQLLRGEGIIFGPFLNLDKYKEGANDALWFDVLDPANVLMEPGPNPREAFTLEVLTAAEMAQRAELDERFRAFKLNGREPTKMVVLVQWYGFEGKDKMCQYAAWMGDHPSIAGTPPSSLQVVPPEAVASEWLVTPQGAGYPYLPLMRVLSGYGMRSPDPEKLAVSILSSQVKSLLVGEAYALSVMDAYMGMATFERYYGPDEASQNKININYQAGSYSVRPPNVYPIEPAPLPTALQQNYDNVVRALQEALFSGVVQGQRPKGVNTASGLAILSGQARLKFGPPLRNLEDAVTKLLHKAGILLDTNEAKLSEFEIMGRKLKSSQLHGDYGVQVELLAEDPEERNARIAQGLQLHGRISERRVHEKYWGIEDYSEEKEQMLYETLISSDAMMQTLEEYLRLKAVERQPGGNGGGGLQAVRTLNAAASATRAGRPGGLPQQRSLPGSVEAAAQMQNQVIGAGRPVQR